MNREQLTEREEVKKMKKLKLVLVVLFLFATILPVNAANRFEDMLQQVDQGVMLLTVTVNAPNLTNLPETLAKQQIIEWLTKGWLVLERPMSEEASKKYRCCWVYQWCNGSYCLVCKAYCGGVNCGLAGCPNDQPQ